jgi:hypothetical protein
MVGSWSQGTVGEGEHRARHLPTDPFDMAAGEGAGAGGALSEQLVVDMVAHALRIKPARTLEAYLGTQ